MTQINPYLTFTDNCREAMTFYQQCLGGELILQTVEESPIAAQMPPKEQKKILHSSLTNGNLILMASEMAREKPFHGNTISLTINCSSEDEITSFFSKLSSGGKIVEPLEEMFWGATYGSLTDKYGITWLFNYDKNSK